MVKRTELRTDNRTTEEHASLDALWALLEDEACICLEIDPADRPCLTCEAAQQLRAAYEADVAYASGERERWHGAALNSLTSLNLREAAYELEEAIGCLDAEEGAQRHVWELVALQDKNKKEGFGRE